MELHDRLKAAVEARMELARAVAGSGVWCAYEEGGDDGWAFETDPGGDPGAIIGDKAITQHVVANDPATILRHCERDLRVLERHVAGTVEDHTQGWCMGCHANFYEEYAEEWPCPEIRDLATAYGIEVTE